MRHLRMPVSKEARNGRRRRVGRLTRVVSRCSECVILGPTTPTRGW